MCEFIKILLRAVLVVVVKISDFGLEILIRWSLLRRGTYL